MKKNSTLIQHLKALAGIACACILFYADAWWQPAMAAPVCAGPIPVSTLGTDGCEFGGVTFSNFGISNASVFGLANPAGIDPNEILVDIGSGLLAIDFLNGIPSIELTVTPSDSGNWIVSGPIGGSLNFTLGYSVATSADFFELYQVGASGNSPFRGGTWSATMDVTNGSGPVTSSFSVFPADRTGTFDPGITAFDVSNSVNVSGGIFTGQLSGFSNDFTLNPVPVPAAVWLFGTALIGLLGFGRRSKTN